MDGVSTSYAPVTTEKKLFDGERQPAKCQRPSANSSLLRAKKNKQDEFYTQYTDIEKELEPYIEFNVDTFRNKIVYCNCDDPFKSNFFKYFVNNFNRLGLKKLITTSYDGSTITSAQLSLLDRADTNDNLCNQNAFAVIIDHVKDCNSDGIANIDDVELFLERNNAVMKPLKHDGVYAGGDFRNADCIDILKSSDIIVTNPPFSLFREYVAKLMEHKKKFIIVGSKNAIVYKEIFPLIKENKLWMGATSMSKNMLFDVPQKVAADMLSFGKKESHYKVVNGKVVGRASSTWFTNVEHGRRHKQLAMMTLEDNLKFSKHKEIRGKTAYDKYDNYDAIDVPFVDAIPSDYTGEMGVPITFMDKYNPEQFDILGIQSFAINGKNTYSRIVIRHSRNS